MEPYMCDYKIGVELFKGMHSYKQVYLLLSLQSIETAVKFKCFKMFKLHVLCALIY